jgi:4-hydroxy-tetrahydrodipicolinate synthase
MFSGSLVAVVTPMHPDGSIDWPAWDRLLGLHLDAGTVGIVVGGTTGESATLTEAELLALLEHARLRVKGRAALIAGAGGSSTAATVERVRRLGAAGTDALLVVTPPYNRPTQEGLYRHFEAVAAAAPVPIVLYNVPTRTGVDLLPTTVARLARLPRIVAIKEAAAGVERIRELLAVTQGAFSVLSGDDAVSAAAILSGARGVISVTANVVPKEMVQLCAAAARGDRAATMRIDSSLAALHAALFLEPNPIPVKWALSELGLIGPGIRLPLTPLSESLHATVRAALEPLRRRSPDAAPAHDAPGRASHLVAQAEQQPPHGTALTPARLA